MSHLELNSLDHLYSTNAAPKPAEAVIIQHQADILTSGILQLQSQIKDMQDQLRKHHGVLSPVRRLPVEIISEIFTFVIPYVLGGRDREDMLNLALVCRNWRNAVFLAHRLWSGLEVRSNPLPACNRITDWFGRSGKVPRTLKFVSGEAGHSSDDCMVEGSQCKLWALPVAKLLSCGPSLHHLAFELNGIGCFKNIVKALESCKVDTDQRPWDSVKIFTLNLRQDCDEALPPSESVYKYLPPLATSLHLTLPTAWAWGSNGWELQDIFFTMPMNIPSNFLESLTTLFISCSWPGPQLFKVLQRCANVLSLTIDFQNDEPQYDFSDPFFQDHSEIPLVLPEVRTLRLRRFTLDGIYLLDFLQAPRLVTLDLDFQGADISEPSACPFHDHQSFAVTLQNFLAGSECEETFQTFRLADACIETQELVQLFRFSLCIVIHLSLENVTLLGGEGYWDLSYFLESPDHLPFLETLELLRLPCSCRGTYIDTLFNSLWSRQPLETDDGVVLPIDGIRFLKKLVVTFKNDDPPLPCSRFGYEHIMVPKWRRYADMFVSIGPVP